MIATKPPQKPEGREPSSSAPNGAAVESPKGGYHKRKVPWASIFGMGVVVLIAVNLIHARLTAVQPLPEGLVQANGRIEGDHVIVSSKYAGRIQNLAAREGDSVSKGQALLSLDDPETRARRDQLSASLSAALAQAQGAGSSVDLTQQTGDAVIIQSRGLVNQAEAAVDAAHADASRSDAAVGAARSAKAVALQNVASARAALDQANANRSRAAAGLEGARSALSASESAVRAAQSQVQAAKAGAEQAQREAKRYTTLAEQGAVPGQRAEQARTAADQAISNLEAVKEQVDAARSNAAGRTSDLDAAKSQLKVADAAVRQAEAQVHAALEQVDAADSGIHQAIAQKQSADAAVKLSEGRAHQAVGQLNQALTAPTQVKVSQSSKKSAEALVNQARSALKEVDSTLGEMSVRSPISGTVVTRFQDQGELVSAGSPVLEIVDLDRLYLKVYIPESLVGKIRIGLPAQIWTDAYPNEPFAAKIGYIASQAEFTPKEIQTATERVSLMYEVRLYLDKNPSHRLTPGLPADAVIRWKDGVEWQRPR